MAGDRAGDPAADDSVAPDTFDAILKKVVRAPAATTGGPRELAAGEVINGRFEIERALGTGGMGTVYAATDRSLGRTVAIKVHHAPGGGVRLRREAIAMARLAHPNVVTVFEVGELEQRPFVVMEYVTGTTLRAWLAAAPRDPSAILEVMIAAGEGLAAAHAAGLIHRDVKPENVLIADDGRTRVGDFGLARDRDSKDDPPPTTAADRLLSPMTQTGAVLGTPAYMAPEQVAGRDVDARTDQFAFCVTAWEAMWGERPFTGATFEELVAALATGAPRPPPPLPKVPPRVRAALERGLSRDPNARFSTMQALLAALRPPARRRRRWIVAALVAGVALGAGAFFVLSLRASPEACVDAAAPANASADLATRYIHARRFACEARANHTWTAELAAKSEACTEVATGVQLASTASMHRLDSCIDPTYLSVSPSVPSDPEKRAALIAARTEIQVADGAPRGAVETALAHLIASPVAGDPEVATGISILRGRVLAFAGKLAESDKLFADAYYAARALDDADDLLAALLALIDNATKLRVDHTTADPWLRAGLADAERLRQRAPWFAKHMYLVDAELANEEEDAPRVLGDLEKARAVMDADDPARIQAGALEAEVLLWTGKVGQGIATYDQALALAERLHTRPAQQALDLSNYASALLAAEQPEKAIAVAERAMKLVAASGDDELFDSARVNLAATLIASDRADEAEALLVTAREHTVARYGEHNARVSNIDGNLALIDGDRGNHASAVARMRSALAVEEAQLGPDHLVVADRLYSIAAQLGMQGSVAEALPIARRALAIYAAKSPRGAHHMFSKLQVASFARATGDPTAALALATEVVDSVSATGADSLQTVAWAYLERGHALLDLGRKTEAHAALQEARAMYATLSMTARTAEADALDRRTR